MLKWYIATGIIGGVMLVIGYYLGRSKARGLYKQAEVLADCADKTIADVSDLLEELRTELVEAQKQIEEAKNEQQE